MGCYSWLKPAVQSFISHEDTKNAKKMTSKTEKFRFFLFLPSHPSRPSHLSHKNRKSRLLFVYSWLNLAVLLPMLPHKLLLSPIESKR